MSRDRTVLAAALAASGLVLAAAWRELPDGELDGWLFDRLAPAAAPGPVLAVAITATDRERFPRFSSQPGRWPWSRLAHAGVLHALQSLGAGAVAFTLFFDRPGEPEGDLGLARELATARIPVLLAAYQAPVSGGSPAPAPTPSLDLGLAAALAAGLVPLEFGSLHPPLPELARAARGLGLANHPSPGPQRTRAVPMVYRAGDALLPSLALATALAARAGEAREVRFEPGPTLVAGSLRVPMTRTGMGILDLARGPAVPVARVLEELSESPRPRPPFAGALVFVGLDDPALASPFATARGDALPACMLEAAAAGAILGGGLLHPAPRTLGLGLVWCVLALASLGAPGLRRTRPLGLGALVLLLPVAGALAALAAGWWLPPTAVLAAAGAGAAVLAGDGLMALLLARRAREAEMGQAEQVAKSLIPRQLPAGVAGRLRPARVAAGDWYDAWRTPDGALMLASVDVSGKGLDAAVLAGQLRAGLKASAPGCPEPAALLGRLNALLEPDLTATGRLASVMLVRLDPDGTYAAAGAGHPPLWQVGPGDALAALEVRGKPLGYRPDTSYLPRTGRLPPGGFLVLVSDGIDDLPEPPDGSGPRGRLRAALARGAREPSALVEAVLGPEAPPADDQTVLVARAPGEP